jgi:hypothetical protein
MTTDVQWKRKPVSFREKSKNLTVIAGLMMIAGVGTAVRSPVSGLPLIGLSVVLLLMDIARSLAAIADQGALTQEP